ncbi:MAG: prohibitin family protein [Gloeocapsa sp. DLM2.Bin57]|nr:MAG: prohibitin family protein [Gloeocapsa sp. DLM2.Bin57]
MKNLNTTQIAKLVILVIGGMVALGFVRKTLITIPAGTVGVKETFGKVAETPLNPGLHLVNPLSKVVRFSTRLEDIKETVEATSQEGLSIQLDVSLQYRANPSKIAEIYQNIGTDEEEIIISRFRSLVREVTAAYSLNSIYGDKRQEVANLLRERLTTSLQPLGFEVEEVLLRKVILPSNVQEAIEAKITAEQKSLQQQFEIQQQRQQIEFDLEKARSTAEREKIEAQARAEREKIAAEATAEAQKKLAEGLTPAILQLKTIEATQSLAQSSNTKIIILGDGNQQLPQIFFPFPNQ